jgi:hypothetical protein
MFACVDRKRGKRGQWGLGKGTKNGAVDSDNGACLYGVEFKNKLMGDRFIFNLRKINNNQYHNQLLDMNNYGTYCTMGFMAISIIRTRTRNYNLYILEQLSSWSTSRIRPSWP